MTRKNANNVLKDGIPGVLSVSRILVHTTLANRIQSDAVTREVSHPDLSSTNQMILGCRNVHARGRVGSRTGWSLCTCFSPSGAAGFLEKIEMTVVGRIIFLQSTRYLPQSRFLAGDDQ